MKNYCAMVGALLCFGLMGCGPTFEDTAAAVRKRAVYDMSCDTSQLKLTRLQEVTDPAGAVISSSYGVEGCNQKIVYQTRLVGLSKVMVYREGAAPDDSVGAITPYQPPKTNSYKSPTSSSKPSEPYRPARPAYQPYSSYRKY